MGSVLIPTGLNSLKVYENHVIRKHPAQHQKLFIKHIESLFSRHFLIRKEKQPGDYRLLVFQFGMSTISSLITIPSTVNFVLTDQTPTQQFPISQTQLKSLKLKRTCDDNLINSMAMSSFDIFLSLGGFHKNPKSKTKRAISVLPPKDERPPQH